MRVGALVCLLFVAGSCALPQSDIAVAEDRIVDLWFLNLFQRFRTFIMVHRLDPMEIDKHEFNVNIINELLQITGSVESFRFTGLGDTRIHDLRYNILFGMLNIDIEFPQLAVSIGKYSVRIVYEGTIVDLEIRGSFAISGIRIAGDAIIEARPGFVNIIAINPTCRIANIQADLTVIGSEDYSETVNNFVNIRVIEFLETFSRQINNIIGELIRIFVGWYWPNF